MVQTLFRELCDFILKYNTYLIEGYCNVYKDNTTGFLFYSKGNDEKEVIFPNDRKRNYFYIRNEGIMNFQLDPDSAISNCMTGATQFQVPLRLVVVLDNSDPYHLTRNMINTLTQYIHQVTIVSAEWNREKIIQVEMAGAPAEDIQAALQRGGPYTLLAITFNVTLPIEFMKANCITNPCLPC